MKKLNVKLDFGNVCHNVGTLYLSEKMGRHAFSYNKDFISKALEISPFRVPLGNDTYTAERNADLYDLHGVFADSLPDEWGKKVQDVEFQKIGMHEVTTVDRLAFVGGYGIGALKYEPSQEFERGFDIVTLAGLRKATQQILSGEVDDVTSQLLRSGGSAGGARPKFLVDLNLKNLSTIRYSTGKPDGDMFPVIIKVPGRRDDQYQRIEYCYSLLGRNAGLNVPDTYLLIGNRSKLSSFAIKRFDINGNGERLHTHTFAGLLGLNFREANVDYSELLRVTGDLTRDHREVVEVFRRMVFNYLGCNKDDHAKNFSFVMNKSGQWFLSPAYDIGYSSGENGLHAMAINGLRRNVTLKDFEKIAKNFEIKEWKSIVAKTCEVLKTWPSIADKYSVPQKYRDAINERIRESIVRIEKDS